MNTLNLRQQQAVTHLGSPLLVIAGAGSGKTGVITHKIAYLIKEAGYRADTIYAVTFTNKAAREMAERSRKLLGKASKGLSISTFHRLGLNLLQQEYAHAGLRARFTVFDAQDNLSLIKALSKSQDTLQVQALKNTLSYFKMHHLLPEHIHPQDEHQRLAAAVYAKYQDKLKAYNAVDFDDLLLIPLRLLKENSEVRQRWQSKVRYLLIDEYQDTNRCQYELIRALTGSGEAFTAVGDDDQSIYAWRGAEPENLIHLHQDYPRLKTIVLNQNYRCDKRILHAANALIANNPHLTSKELWSHIDDGDGVHIYRLRNEESEAEFIASDIISRKIQHNYQNKDFAILYRSNFQARMFEQQLRELRLPYRISGGTSFFEYSEIRDLLSYLRLISNPDDDNAFLRICNIPKREIGDNTVEKLGAYAHKRGKSMNAVATESGLSTQLTPRASQALAQFANWLERIRRDAETLPPSQLLSHILHDIEYNDYLEENAKNPNKSRERIKQLQAWIQHLETDARFQRLDALMQHLTLLDILEKQDKAQDAVELMTLHSAKGLEFKVVYLVGVEENLLPHRNSVEQHTGIEEERRLMYVGMTRAKKTLVITYTKQRKSGSDTQAVEPSRFLEELPQENIAWHDGRYPLSTEDAQAKRAKLFDTLEKITTLPTP